MKTPFYQQYSVASSRNQPAKNLHSNSFFLASISATAAQAGQSQYSAPASFISSA